jgi:hypothetical protein
MDPLDLKTRKTAARKAVADAARQYELALCAADRTTAARRYEDARWSLDVLELEAEGR